jgi:hypothetical protein
MCSKIVHGQQTKILKVVRGCQKTVQRSNNTNFQKSSEIAKNCPMKRQIKRSKVVRKC